MTLRTAAVLLTLFLAGPAPSSGQAPAPHLLVNDRDVTLQTAPVVQDGILLLPADLIARAFGAAAQWDASAQVLTLTGASGRHVQLTSGRTQGDVDGRVVTLPVAPLVRQGTLWAPAAAVLRALGAYVADADDGRTQIALAQIEDIAWRSDGNGLAVRISASGPVRVEAYSLHQPERLVVDLSGAVARLKVPSQDIGIGGVARVREAQFQVNPFITRIVFDLDRAMKFAVETRSGEVAVALGDAPAAGGARRPAAGAQVPPPSAPSRPSGSVSSSAAPQGTSSAPSAPSVSPPPSSETAVAVAGSRGPADRRLAAVQSPPPAGPTAATGSSGPADRRLPAAHARRPGQQAGSGSSGPADRRLAPTQTQGSPQPPVLRGSRGPADRRVAADAGGPPAGGDVRPATAPEPLALPPLPDFPDGPGAFHIQAVAYDDQEHAGLITIRASQHLKYVLRQFVYPDRLAIDISGGVYRPRRQDIEVDSDAVRNIVISQLQLRPNVTRVLVHLNHKLPYRATAGEDGRTLIVTLGDPGRRLARVSSVIIDPGHGGSDGGAVGPSGLREADVALAISRFVRDDLTAAGIPSVMTRTDDSTVALEDRPDLAVRNGGILFISIHANGSRSIGSAGTESYFKTPISETLARVMQAEVTQALGEPDRGIHTADFYVLVNTPMPAVLVETAFITNPAEEALLRDPAVQRRIADAIARAVAKYLGAERQPGSFAPGRPAGPAHGPLGPAQAAAARAGAGADNASR